MKTPESVNKSKPCEPGNVFSGKIVHVIAGPSGDLVTVRIARGVELTVKMTRIPCVGDPKLPCPMEPGQTITIALPPPHAVEIKAFGGANR